MRQILFIKDEISEPFSHLHDTHKEQFDGRLSHLVNETTGCLGRVLGDDIDQVSQQQRDLYVYHSYGQRRLETQPARHIHSPGIFGQQKYFINL